LLRVGLKINTGGETTMLSFGLNAVEKIHATGRKNNSAIDQAPMVANFIGPALRFGLKILFFSLLSCVQDI
jgi:hypothetical protein